MTDISHRLRNAYASYLRGAGETDGNKDFIYGVTCGFRAVADEFDLTELSAEFQRDAKEILRGEK